MTAVDWGVQEMPGGINTHQDTRCAIPVQVTGQGAMEHNGIGLSLKVVCTQDWHKRGFAACLWVEASL